MKRGSRYETATEIAHLNSSFEMENNLRRYKKEMEDQLEAILSWWMVTTLDEQNGGFVGKIDHNNIIYPEAPKGSVLNSRILWTFSSGYNLTGNKEYLNIAERAFNYFAKNFIDKEFGGVYWTVNFKGQPLDDKKQIYALAFAMYGLSVIRTLIIWFYFLMSNGNRNQISSLMDMTLKLRG